MALRRKPLAWFAAALLLSSPNAAAPARAEQIDSIKDLVAKLYSCWKSPPTSRANPIDITVRLSFTREGSILGHPRITYESDGATDNDRLMYRVAVMEALQRCEPLPFTEGLGGAIAGRPIAVRFKNRKPPPKPVEKSAWLTPKIL